MIGPALLLFATLASAPGDACGLPPAGEPPWRTGESMTLALDLLGAVRAGTLSLAVERPMSGGAIVPLRARARTDPSLATVKKVVAVALSWVDARTLLPERFRDESEEDGLRRSSDARIAPGAGELTISSRTGEREAARTYRPEGPVLDVLSALYYLRAARISPGDRFCFDVVALGRLWRVEGAVARKTERVSTPAGSFRTHRVDAVARVADRPETRREVHLWISADPRRLLVAAVGEVELGPVRAVLTSVEGRRR